MINKSLNLPNEILVDIFYQLNLTDLKNSSLVCKNWYSVSQMVCQILYKKNWPIEYQTISASSSNWFHFHEKNINREEFIWETAEFDSRSYEGYRLGYYENDDLVLIDQRTIQIQQLKSGKIKKTLYFKPFFTLIQKQADQLILHYQLSNQSSGRFEFWNLEIEKKEKVISFQGISCFDCNSNYFCLVQENAITVWDYISKKNLIVNELAQELIQAVKLKEHWLIVAYKNQVDQWNLLDGTKKTIIDLKSADFSICSVLINYNYDLIILSKNNIKVFKQNSNDCLFTLGNPSSINQVKINGSLLAVAMSKRVEIFNYQTGRIISSSCLADNITALDFKENKVFAGLENGQFAILNIENQIYKSFESCYSKPITAICYDHDRLIVEQGDLVTIYKLDSENLLEDLIHMIIKITDYFTSFFKILRST